MDFPPDWDLLALVRSCSSTTAAAAVSTTSSTPLRLLPQQEQLSFSPTPSTSSSSSVLFGFSNGGQQDFFNNYNMSSSNSFQSLSCSSLTSPVSASSFTVGQLYPEMRRSHVIFEGSSPGVTATSTGATSQSQRATKRRNLMKKVCHIPAEGLSSDMWAWRKYGQKPIKGSPYPRGYYRCSSSKGCLARKQVERNRTDPKMLIVTYTSEHNHPIPAHRNTLAGSTRQKTITSTVTPPPSSTEKSESKIEGEELIKDDEDNDIERFSDLMFNDDFFVGFENIAGGGSDDSDCFSEPAAEFPWLATGEV